jgi:glutathione synthase
MDPLAGVQPAKDTSYIFMLGAQRRGHAVWYVPNAGIHMTADGVSFDATRVTPQPDHAEPFVVGESVRLGAADVGAVFIRTDPPFDDSYLMNTWLLDHLPAHVPVINSPSGVRTVNEKVWALQFDAFVPPTLVTANIERYREFLADHQKVVVKPANGFGGQGVFIVEAGDTNASVVFETLSEGARTVIVQRYIPEARIGDKRILLLDGEPLGAVLRVHGDDDHRNNFFAGGQPVATEINERERTIISALQPHLRRLGLAFVGIDMLGDYLIEVNVTSPTCLQEMNRFYDQQLENTVIAYVESQLLEEKAS